jgi:hypothetical protein
MFVGCLAGTLTAFGIWFAVTALLWLKHWVEQRRRPRVVKANVTNGQGWDWKAAPPYGLVGLMEAIEKQSGDYIPVAPIYGTQPTYPLYLALRAFNPRLTAQQLEAIVNRRLQEPRSRIDQP